MFSSRTNRLPKGVFVALFGLMAIVLIACPRGASAMTRVSFGLQIDVGDYDYLEGYGEWVHMPGFGTVWHPYVVNEWSPFMQGHWIWTYDGWAWVSYEPFGWLVYHYGYWYHRPHIGWFWVPGRIWSPACVEWYTFGDYCAWAPLPPPGYDWYDPWHHWGFNVWYTVDMNHFCDDEVWRHTVPPPPHRDIYKRDVLVRRSPTIRQVEMYTKRQIEPVRISRERVQLRNEPAQQSAKYYRPKEAERKRMVLPQQEQTRMQQYTPRVEREVLVPKDSAPKHDEMRAPRPAERTSQPAAKQSESTNQGHGKKEVRRR